MAVAIQVINKDVTKDVSVEEDMVITVHSGDTIVINESIETIGLQIVNEVDLQVILPNKSQLLLMDMAKWLVSDEGKVSLEFETSVEDLTFEIATYSQLLDALNASAQASKEEFVEYNFIESEDIASKDAPTNEIAEHKRSAFGEDFDVFIRDNDEFFQENFVKTSTDETTKPPADETTETPTEESQNNTILGGRGRDVITGTSDNDIIEAFKGKDIINAGDGDDIIDAGRGKDIINAGDGNDMIDGGKGKDRINAQGGDDTIVFDKRDSIDGGTGFDTILVEDINKLNFKKLKKIDNIENISLEDGIQNELKNVSVKDILAITDNDNTLFITGDEGDVLHFKKEKDWIKTDQKVQHEGKTYDVWTKDDVTLNIDEDIMVDI